MKTDFGFMPFFSVILIGLVALTFTGCGDSTYTPASGQTGDVYRLIWQGAFPNAPANPDPGWVYYNTGDNKAWVFFNNAWHQLGLDGAPGPAGTQLEWKGESATSPANPKEGWVYRLTGAGITYIYLNGDWRIIAKDGQGGGGSLQPLVVFPPDKTVYYLNESFSINGMKVGFYFDGLFIQINNYNWIWNGVSNPDNNQIKGITATTGTKTIIVIDFVGRTAAFDITVNDVVLGEVITTPAELNYFLSMLGEEGASADNPVFVPPIAALDMGGDTWYQFLQTIDNNRKYVELDFSACGNMGSIEGEEGTQYIVSIVLPNTITILQMVNFSSIRKVSGLGVTSVHDYAFRHLQNLKTLYIPSVTNIGKSAFASTGSTSLTITMGETPPSVNSSDNGLFAEIYPSKTVTVFVPKGAAGNYNSEWQTNFKGGNTYINLIIQEIEG